MSKMKRSDRRPTKTGPSAHMLSRFYRAAGLCVNAMRNHAPQGRKLTALLNSVGSFFARSFLFAGRQFAVRGHNLALAGSRGPSPAFGLDMILGRYETHVAEWFEEVVKPGMIVLDLGAHVGFFTLLAADLVGPKGTVYAFEPEPENFAVLSKNIASGNYGNVKVVQKAIMNRQGRVDLFVSRQGNDRHSVYENPRSFRAESHVEVESTSLDDFVEQLGWPQIDVIKMDIEGAEPAAVEGMARLLARSKGLKLLLEFAPELLESANVNPAAFLGRLSELGFALTSIEDDGTRKQLHPDTFGLFVESVQGATNLICDLKKTGLANDGLGFSSRLEFAS